jgi:hypothetical protein
MPHTAKAQVAIKILGIVRAPGIFVIGLMLRSYAHDFVGIFRPVLVELPAAKVMSIAKLYALNSFLYAILGVSCGRP